MQVGFFQFEPVFGEVARNLDTVEAQVASQDCELLVLPELAMSGYQFLSQEEVAGVAEEIPDGVTTRRLIELARGHGMFLIAGLPERHGGHLYNSAILVGPAGFVGLYRKTHLFFEETLLFSPGNTGFQVWDIGQAKVGILICFDWVFPESARTLALKGAEILCHPSNLLLPHCPDAMVTRCLENRVFGLTANRIGRERRGGNPPLTFIGKSEIIAPSGEILCRASADQQEYVVRTIDSKDARDKSLNPYNDLFHDRRPEWYQMR